MVYTPICTISSDSNGATASDHVVAFGESEHLVRSFPAKRYIIAHECSVDDDSVRGTPGTR